MTLSMTLQRELPQAQVPSSPSPLSRPTTPATTNTPSSWTSLAAGLLVSGNILTPRVRRPCCCESHDTKSILSDSTLVYDTPVILEYLQQIYVALSPFVYCPPNNGLGGLKLKGGQFQLDCLLDAMYGLTGPDVNRDRVYTIYFILEVAFDGLNPDLHGGTVQQWRWLLYRSSWALRQ
jgi:hypothetical protein